MPAPKPHTEADPDFVYVIYIATTPQKVWDALTDGETARAWWANTRHECTFEVGAPLTFVRDGAVNVRGEILEREEPNRLVYTFHVEGPGPQHDEGPTLVTYEIVLNGATTMLKVTHTNFKRDSAVRRGISQGWPAILSAMKSVLEGHATPAYTRWGEPQPTSAAQ